MLSVFCSRVFYMFLGKTVVLCMTQKRRLTGEPFDADADMVVIERIFLTALVFFECGGAWTIGEGLWG